MVTNYEAVPVTGNEGSSYDYRSAVDICLKIDGQVANMPEHVFEKFTNYLYIWRHNYKMGNIWINTTLADTMCSIIQVQIA